MDAAHLKDAVDTARRCGLTANEALTHWELAGGVAAGDAAIHWALIAVELAASRIERQGGPSNAWADSTCGGLHVLR
jgi:hypothetical protein